MGSLRFERERRVCRLYLTTRVTRKMKSGCVWVSRANLTAFSNTVFFFLLFARSMYVCLQQSGQQFEQRYNFSATRTSLFCFDCSKDVLVLRRPKSPFADTI